MSDKMGHEKLERLSKEVGERITNAPPAEVPPAVERRVIEGIRRIAAEPARASARSSAARRWSFFGGLAAVAAAASLAIVVSQRPAPSQRSAEVTDDSWLLILKDDGLRGQRTLGASDKMDVERFLGGLEAAAQRDGKTEVATAAATLKGKLRVGVDELAVDVPSCPGDRQRRIWKERDRETVVALLRVGRDGVEVVLYPAPGSALGARVAFNGVAVTDAPTVPVAQAERLLAEPTCDAR